MGLTSLFGRKTSKEIFNKKEAAIFFELLWGNANDGYLALCGIKSKRISSSFVNLSKDNALERSSKVVELLLGRQEDSYHTLGLFRTPPKNGRRGEENGVIAIPGFWMDIDVASGVHQKTALPQTKEDAIRFLQSLPFFPTIIVHSGGGLHVYWLFKEPWYFDNDAEKDDARLMSKQFQTTLIHRAENEYGWKLDITGDLVRLLRVPGTFNFKREPVPVKIIEQNDQRYEPDDFEPYLLEEGPISIPISRPNIAAYSDCNSSLLKAVKGCAFLGHCREDAKMLPEPDWFCMIAALCFEGKSRPVIHQLSNPYPNYSYEETESKIKHCQDGQAGPMRCETIREKTGFKCPPECKEITTRPVELRYRLQEHHVEKSEISEQSASLNSKDGEARPWPKLENQALSGFAGRFVEVATTNSEADPAAVLVTFLCRVGIECGPIPLMIGDTPHYPRLFSVIVGNSSKARKGTSANSVKRLFDLKKEDYPDFKTARHSPGPLSSGEGLIWAVRDPSQKWEEDKKTGEGKWVTYDEGVGDKRFFIQEEEFAAALSSVKREGNTLSTIIRCMWDSGDLEPLTKNSQIKATGAHIGIVAHITLEELKQKLSETEAFNGFANRFIWCASRRSKLVPFPEPIPEGELAALQDELIEILKKCKTSTEINLSDECKKKWIDSYEKLSKEDKGLVGNILARSEAQVLRIAMVYALLDGENVIQLKHLEAALTLWDYCEKSVRYIFAGHESVTAGEKGCQNSRIERSR